MRRTLFPQALATLAACTLFLVSAGASAQATFTFTDQNCSDFTLGPLVNGSRTLNCVVNSAPTCTVTGPNAGTINSNITLTASCSPAATSWAWTSTAGTVGTCATSSCNDNGSGYTNLQQVTYTVTGSNINGPGPKSPNFVVTWSTAPVAPTGCTISGAPAGPVAKGTAIALAVNCTGGGQPTSWSWTGSPCGTSVIATCNGNINSTTTYTATACSAPGVCMTTPGVQITVSGGGGGGALDCSTQLAAHGIANGNTIVVDIAWPNDGSVHQYFTSQAGGMFGNTAVVARFTTSAAVNSSSKGSIVFVEYQSSPSERKGALNTTPCDFDTGIQLSNCAGQTTKFDTNGPSFGLWQSTSTNRNCALTLQPSTTYYFNMYNAPGATCTSQASCDGLFNFQKPGGS